MLSTCPIIQLSHCSQHGLPLFALAANNPHDNSVLVALTEIAIKQLFQQKKWSDPATTCPTDIDDASAATRRCGHHFLTLLKSHAKTMGHRVAFMLPLITLMAQQTTKKDIGTTTISDAVNQALNMTYPHGSRLMHCDEHHLTGIELFWHRELKLFAGVLRTLIEARHAPSQSTYLKACSEVIAWKPHQSPLDTLYRKLTAKTVLERTALSLIQYHEAGPGGPARAELHTPTSFGTHYGFAKTISFFMLLILADLVLNAVCGMAPTGIGLLAVSLLALASAFSVPTELEPEKLLISAAQEAVTHQLLRTAISWGLAMTEYRLGKTFLSPDVLEHLPAYASLLLRISLLGGAIASVQKTWQSMSRLGPSLRKSDADNLWYSALAGTVSAISQAFLAPTLQSLLRAVTDPHYSAQLTVLGALIPELGIVAAGSPATLAATSISHCIDNKTITSWGSISVSAISVGPCDMRSLATQPLIAPANRHPGETLWIRALGKRFRLNLGIGGGASFTSLPRQAGLYQQTAKAAQLLTAYGHTLTSQVSQQWFYPSIELSSTSRLQTMAAALLANTKPDGYGKAQTSSPIVNTLLNQQLTLTSSADKTDKITLLQLYHQNQKQQASRLLADSLTGKLVQAIRAQFCSSDAKTLTAASSNFINRLVSISNTIASANITSDPLAENNVIWFFCAKHTATEIRTAMRSLFAKTTIRQDTFAADASNQAQVVKAYLRMLARPDYSLDNTEMDILYTSLGARQVHGSVTQLNTTSTKPSPAAAAAAPVIPTTEDGKTALALPWWQHCSETALALPWWQHCSETALALPWWQHCSEGVSQFAALVERWWNSP